MIPLIENFTQKLQFKLIQDQSCTGSSALIEGAGQYKLHCFQYVQPK